MSGKLKLQATSRDRVGKGSAREARRQDLVPAVIYGDKKDPLSITLDGKDLFMAMKEGHFFTSLCNITLDGKEHLTLARDVQVHPVTDIPMHVDFLRVTEKTRVTANVPVAFINEEESKALDTGGILSVNRHEVELSCPATSIPDQIEFDLTKLEAIGDNVRFSDLDLPKGIEGVIDDRDILIAAVVAPKTAEEIEAEEAAEDAEDLADGETDDADSDEDTSDE